MIKNKDKNVLYIEKQQNGAYAVKKADAKRASAVAQTQKQAIKKAEKLNPGAEIHVERVRDTKKGGRDQWRKP